eukprot:2866145-Amphidinium_carterae.1
MASRLAPPSSLDHKVQEASTELNFNLCHSAITSLPKGQINTTSHDQETTANLSLKSYSNETGACQPVPRPRLLAGRC